MEQIENIDFAALYGVEEGESDFFGAVRRSIKQIKEDGLPHLDKFMEMFEKELNSDNYQLTNNGKNNLKKYYSEHPEAIFEHLKINLVHDATKELIWEYNVRMKDDDNYPDKDEVRRWFGLQSSGLVMLGASSFSFLYPDFIGPLDDYRHIYNK